MEALHDTTFFLFKWFLLKRVKRRMACGCCSFYVCVTSSFFFHLIFVYLAFRAALSCFVQRQNAIWQLLTRVLLRMWLCVLTVGLFTVYTYNSLLIWTTAPELEYRERKRMREWTNVCLCVIATLYWFKKFCSVCFATIPCESVKHSTICCDWKSTMKVTSLIDICIYI